MHACTVQFVTLLLHILNRPWGTRFSRRWAAAITRVREPATSKSRQAIIQFLPAIHNTQRPRGSWNRIIVEMARAPPRGVCALALAFAAAAALAAALPSAAAQQAITCPANCLSCVRTRTIIKPQYQATRKLQTAPFRIQWCVCVCADDWRGSGAGCALLARCCNNRTRARLIRFFRAASPPHPFQSTPRSFLTLIHPHRHPKHTHTHTYMNTQHRLRHRLRAEQADPHALRLRRGLRRRRQEQPMRRVPDRRGRAAGRAGALPVHHLPCGQGAQR